MPAYTIARVDIHDDENYKKYAEIATEAIQKFGGEILVRGGEAFQMEGKGRKRNVIIKWPDMKTAKEFYHSDLYQKALTYGVKAAVRDYTLVEGV